MVESSNNKAVPSASASDAATNAPPAAGWKPTETAKAQATKLRWIAMALWIVAIALEAVSIFWLLRQREFVGEDGVLVRVEETGLIEAQGATATFPQWAFVSLIIALVVIAALAVTGSFLWKKANRLDPAKQADKVRFFVQNQLGAIIAIIAFLPLIILIFTNKDMDGKQKGIAGAIGIVLALAATALSIDYNPASVEKYNADQSTVIQLLGADEVVWVAGGSVYHVCEDVSDIQTGSDKVTGTTAEAIEAGKTRLTLKFASELRACGLNVPENASEIESALKAIQGGANDVTLPAPEWANPEDAPIAIKDAPATA
ncbi:hypothetical protein [Leucobacter komagatae]|uniref:Uncharacterized protein n=1 Tax=Leucobacter komagatae TaxID=55969 RepID=A0A0D0IQ07_9MICO|nr:hypothetical protein [Leucobacter komagatae]KIP53679.1 hypothetical protein SD72_00120 [Leucobacter komagatae]